MALAFTLIKQMLKLENRSKDACNLGSDLGIASLALSCGRKIKASLPQPTLELNTFHRWPGVFCSSLPQGLHQTLLPLQLKLKDSTVGQWRCPGQRAFQNLNSAPEYQQVMTANSQEKAQHQLQLLFA